MCKANLSNWRYRIIQVWAASKVDHKKLASIQELENHALTSLNMNATNIEDLQPLKIVVIEGIKHFQHQTFKHRDMTFIHTHMTYLVDLNIGGADNMTL